MLKLKIFFFQSTQCRVPIDYFSYKDWYSGQARYLGTHRFRWIPTISLLQDSGPDFVGGVPISSNRLRRFPTNSWSKSQVNESDDGSNRIWSDPVYRQSPTGILATDPLTDPSEKNLFNYFWINYSLKPPIGSVTTFNWIPSSSDTRIP